MQLSHWLLWNEDARGSLLGVETIWTLAANAQKSYPGADLPMRESSKDQKNLPAKLSPNCSAAKP